MGLNPKSPGYIGEKNQGEKFKFIFDLYQGIPPSLVLANIYLILAHGVPGTEDVGQAYPANSGLL